MNEFSSAKIQTSEEAAKLSTLPPIHLNKKPIQVDKLKIPSDKEPVGPNYQNQQVSPGLMLPPGFEQAGQPRAYVYGQPQPQPAWALQQPMYPVTQPQIGANQASAAHMLSQTRQHQYVPENMPLPQFNDNAAFGAEDPSLSRKLGLSSRIGFIRKVYAILSVQLAITAIFTIAALKSVALQEFMVKNTALFFVMMVVYFVSIYALACYPKIARSVPINYILTFVFTAAMSYLVGFICSRSDPNLVATAAILTAVMMLGLTTYACYTKTDFTMCGGFLFVMSFLLIAMIFVGIWVSNKFYHAVVSVISIGLFSLYIIYDTQLIVGNKESKYMLDDYIMAAINLYLDIINLFLSILRLLGAASKSS